MFSKIVIWKKLDHALNTKYHWTIIKTILSKHCNGQKDKENVLQDTVNCIYYCHSHCISLINLIIEKAN